MDGFLILAAYHVASMLCGTAFAYMGYKLFCKGIFDAPSDIQVKLSKDRSLTLKRGAPGTIFGLFGAVIVIVSIWRGLYRETTQEGAPSAEATAKEFVSTLSALKPDEQKVVLEKIQ